MSINRPINQSVNQLACVCVGCRSAQWLSAYRPRCPIIAVSRDEMSARQLRLYRGVIPLIYTGSYFVPVVYLVSMACRLFHSTLSIFSTSRISLHFRQECKVLWSACMCVCLCLCLAVTLSVRSHTLETQSKFRVIFCTCYLCLWPWLGPPLTAMQYVMYFQFCG